MASVGTPQEGVDGSNGEKCALLAACSVDDSENPFEQYPRRRKPIPPPLVIQGDGGSDLPLTSDPLRDFAIIATSPRSPLMQKNLPIRKRAFSFSGAESLHSYARSPQIPLNGIFSPLTLQSSSTSSLNCSYEDVDQSLVTSSSPFPASPSSGPWSHTWPNIVWQCFVKGTRVKFTNNKLENDTEESSHWRLAEEVGWTESLAEKASQHQETQLTRYAPNGLRLIRQEHISVAPSPILSPPFSPTMAMLRLSFTPDVPDQLNLTVECAADHPFFVQDEGWSSVYPDLTVRQYGIPCRPLQMNDVCLPRTHPAANFTAEIFESFRSFAFTPEDTSAAFTLSNMAKQKQQDCIQTGAPVSPPISPVKGKMVSLNSSDLTKPKRPMNGFMLFAKQHRVEYTQLYPGKDNRAISVLLGDTWKRMRNEERHAYAEQARLLAEEHKKLYPDCWKRKRVASSSS